MKKNNLFGVIIILTFLATIINADDLMTRREAELQKFQHRAKVEGWTFSVDHNPVFDLSDEERNTFTSGGIPSDVLDSSVPLWSPTNEEMDLALSRDSFDWRNQNGQNWMTPVKNQGSCGSCWAYASCGVVEANEKINANTAWIDPDYSEQYIISCIVGDCLGHGIDVALDALRDNGVTGNNCYLEYHTNPPPSCSSHRCANWDDDLHFIDGYYRILPSNETTIKAAITSHGPVVSYMSPEGSFETYSGGIFNDCEDAGGGHFVVIVGWNDTENYWICKSSSGTNWGENGYFRIVKGSDCRKIEGEVYWIDPQYWPNIDGYAIPSGWDYPLVPRNDNGANANSTHISPVLDGNTNSTYVNFTAYNTSSMDSTYCTNYYYVDDNLIDDFTWDSVPRTTSAKYNNMGSYTIPGGRHTLRVVYDALENFWELSEDFNTYSQQFVWSPYNLGNSGNTIHSAPPITGTGSYANCDGFSFQTNANFWGGVAILPLSMAADYDIFVCNDYSGSESGFSTYLATSNSNISQSDFVLFTGNPGINLTRYAGVINYNGESSQFVAQSSISPGQYLPGDSPLSGTIPPNQVFDIWTVAANSGDVFGFTVHEENLQDVDFGISIYSAQTKGQYLSKNDSIELSNYNGVGEDETLTVIFEHDEWCCFVVWKSYADDLPQTLDYTITFGTPTPTPTPLTGLTCASAIPVQCDSIYTGDTTGYFNNYEEYSCQPQWIESGPEIFYKFNVDQNYSEISASLSGLTTDLDIFILGSCDENDCLGYGDATAILTGSPIPYKTYYIVVDGSDDAFGAFSLSFDCTQQPSPTPLPGSSCSEAIPITCNSVYSGNTTNYPMNIETYSCTSWTESGPEIIYELNLDTDYTSISATLSDLSTDLDIFVLASCDPDDCVSFGDYAAHLTGSPIQHGIYYYIVDGYNGDSGSYTLELSCTQPASPTPTNIPTYTPTSVPTNTPTPAEPTHTPTPEPSATPVSTNTPQPTTTPACLNHGDVNFSGSLTSVDAQLTFNIVMGLLTPTYEEECAADCNGDGSVTASDAQTIFYKVLGIGVGCVDEITL